MAARDQDRLWREARRLCATARRQDNSRRPLPPLFFVTDPARTSDPLGVARTLPPGCGLIYRSFGDPDAVGIARALKAVADKRGLILLIGADAALAARVKAHGLHLPERAVAEGRALRVKHPGWIITGAAHSARALHRVVQHGLDAALLSPVFSSRSASAGAPLGPIRFARLVRGARTAVYALGGVNACTVGRLAGTGAAGVAAVDGLQA